MITTVYAVTDAKGKAIHVTPMYKKACELAQTWAVLSQSERRVVPLTNDEDFYDAMYQIERETE